MILIAIRNLNKEFAILKNASDQGVNTAPFMECQVEIDDKWSTIDKKYNDWRIPSVIL